MPNQAAQPGRLLVVDDQPANLKAVSALLSRQGYEVATASQGEQALELAAAQAPDLLLLDMMMPGMDGFELLAELRKRPALQQVPVIFLTAAQDRELLLRAFAAGAVDYVTKPFFPEELLARVNAHIGLKLTRDRLERVAHERQELVNLVAHDLKNPLSSVLFASEVLQQGACKPERVPRYLAIIHESTRDAIGYIRRYLEAQKQVAAAGARGGVVEHPACLHGLLEWLVERYELQLEARGMRLRVERAGDGPLQVAIDARVLRQVAENLVSNAIKYAAGGGELTLAVRRGAGGHWQLRVEDRGDGVPPERQGELFRPFARLGVREDGMSSGLGLSLARQIVVNAGGNLWYEDREGGGACFVIELPVLQAGTTAAREGVAG
ncbi:MAG TPA: hybrid sensor histidine kinase/response regulator [Xanthomonadaceae bacterium]|nr:hybrid sensor histidine kinase/response regulator [Xanthomonadaceae bacterium]